MNDNINIFCFFCCAAYIIFDLIALIVSDKRTVNLGDLILWGIAFTGVFHFGSRLF